MEHPLLNVIQQKEEMITNFTGYNHTLTATEGSYYDMRNMSSDYYPAMSPRSRACRSSLSSMFDKFQGMVDREGVIWWVNNQKLYKSYPLEEISGISFTEKFQQIVKMGTKLVFFPDKKWYDTAVLNSYGSLELSVDISSSSTPAEHPLNIWYAREDGSFIWASGIEADGEYKIENSSGAPAVYQYSDTTKTWNAITPVYTAISVSDTSFSGFNEGDGIKITLKSSDLTSYEKQNIFVNHNYTSCSGVFTILKKPGGNTIVLPFTLDVSHVDTTGTLETFTFSNPASISRNVPDMDFVIECQNRLWGCSPDGHEIYASKLGTPMNWNVFQGISTDSWAATVGSDGVFTGAINYRGNPLFFKEDSIIKISISSVGGHSYTEVKCRGVQTHAEKSLAIVNDILYYKAPDCICAYDGSYPISISDALGDVGNYDYGVSGSYRDKYYVYMWGRKRNPGSTFVYDTKHGIWVKTYNKTDNKSIRQFCNSNNLLYFAINNELYSIGEEDVQDVQSQEAPIEWFVESNNIGYLYTGKSYRSRINKKQYIQKMIMQVSLAVGSHISVYINYDSSDEWEFLYNFSGSNANLCKIPIRPHRCNHFRYKIVGHGDAKIFSITKYYTEGSDV